MRRALLLLWCVILFTTLGSRARVGGNTWYQTANLLKNPSASIPSVSPYWAQTGTWSINSGSVTIGSLTMNSSDASPWFLAAPTAYVVATCSSCGSNVTVALTQTVDLSAYANTIHAYSTGITYGGEALAEGRASGTGMAGYYHSQAGYEASFTLEFLDANGNVIASDTTGNILTGPTYGCVLGSWVRQTVGYRRTVSGIPQAARAVRFIARMNDRLSTCYNQTSSAGFRNGFDSLSLEFGYLGAASKGFVSSRQPK